MKSILSLAIALVALFSVNTAVAQNPHFVENTPCFSGSNLSVHIAGLGNNQLITITVTGTAICEQQNNPRRENQVTNDFNSKFTVRSDKNGNVNLDEPIRTCPGGFTGSIQTATVCVFEGRKASGEPLIPCTEATACR